MPVYEEKLLCPLSIRFTQGHIRSAFRDGRDVEASCAEIKAKTVSDGGSYDVVLDAPFPSIEIVRWAPGHRSQGGSRCPSRSDGQSETDRGSSDSDDPDEEQWFTYDNRRLYCLQRAALEHWPKRVAAVVQVMYVSNKNMLKRKFDSLSLGREVDIMRMGEDTPYDTFSWRKREALLLSEARRAVGVPRAARNAFTDAIAFDEDKESVDELQNAPQEPSGLDIMMRALAQEEEKQKYQQAAAVRVPAAAAAAVGPHGGPCARRFQNRGSRAARGAAASRCVPVAG